MIYDKGPLQICELSGGTALRGRLLPGPLHLYAELEVYHRRFWESVQADSQIDRLVRVPWGRDLDAGLYCILPDEKDPDPWRGLTEGSKPRLIAGHVYKIVQAQHGTDEDGQPCCTLSLMRKEDNYDLAAVN